ncbi:MAG: 16S rRNA (uracil(1498)-N(3))-methyltransferase [Actinobacteria bacterium]|nr:16S rRNA (uracil(1498)-N(3))-methyltransferase [Actinomycetota bacterium]
MGTVRAAAHVFVDDLDAPALSSDDGHHLSRVLRLRAGEVVTASDGAGRWRACSFADGGVLRVTGDVVVEPAPAPSITVGFALTKGERPEWTVQKLTELGVDRIVPLAAARSVVRLEGDRAAAQHRRWQKVAREAAMQSRRVWLPAVEPVTAVATVLDEPGVAVAEAGGGPPGLEWPTVLVGPEGGWSEEELAAADGANAPRVDLGPTVLRAETAAITVAALLCGMRTGIVRANSAKG